MLPSYMVFVAVGIRLLGGAGYIASVVRGHAKPNPLTWFFWALTALITAIAQFYQGVGNEAWVSLGLAVGPLVIFALSIIYCRDQMKLTPINATCGALATLGVALWQATNDPVLAIVFSIIADASASIPTVLKAYRKPASETPWPYVVSMISMAIALGTVTTWDFSHYGYIAYILLINLSVAIAYFFGQKSNS